MLVSLAITESRYPHQMTSDEINQALRHARALTAANPPIAISRPLAIFIGELLTELRRREEAGDSERQITDFSRKELREALVHVKALRALQPRQQIQVCMLDCLFAITAELESRSKAKRNHATSVAKGLKDDWTASAGDS
jgi:hypothetical protein